MVLPLSPNIANAVEKLFSDKNKEEAVLLLTEYCAENLPNCEKEDEYGLESLRFQALKLSEGNIEKLRDAIRMANEDWQNLRGIRSQFRFKDHDFSDYRWIDPAQIVLHIGFG